MTRFGTWLNEQRKADTADGVDLYGLACDAVRMTEYTEKNLADGRRALLRVQSRIPLASVSEEEARATWEEGRDSVVESIAACLTALSHILVAVGCTDHELSNRYTNPDAPDHADDGFTAPEPSDESSESDVEEK